MSNFLSIFSDSTDPTDNATSAAGKVVLLFHSETNDPAYAAGAVGIISSTEIEKNDFLPCRVDLPCISVDYAVGAEILLYIRSTRYSHHFLFQNCNGFVD